MYSVAIVAGDPLPQQDDRLIEIVPLQILWIPLVAATEELKIVDVFGFPINPQQWGSVRAGSAEQRRWRNVSPPLEKLG